MMKKNKKKLFLQIRVSDEEKKAIQNFAKNADMDMSQWVLSQVLKSKQQKFQELIKEITRSSDVSYGLAEFSDFLNSLNVGEFKEACFKAPEIYEDPFLSNYVAAMVEQAAVLKNTFPPDWTKFIFPLEHPYFPTDLKKLRMYLLMNALPSFRRRNLFVDTGIGGRV